MPSYKYSITQTANHSLDKRAFGSELKSSGLRRAAFSYGADDIDVLFDEELSVAEKNVLDRIVADHKGLGDRLVVAKKSAIEKVSARTARLIGSGTFEYGGKRFSMTMTDQLNSLGAYNARNLPGFEYPVTRYTADNTDSVDLDDADAVATFYGATLAAVRAVRDGGADLKARVNAATTPEQVDAIVDSR